MIVAACVCISLCRSHLCRNTRPHHTNSTPSHVSSITCTHQYKTRAVLCHVLASSVHPCSLSSHAACMRTNRLHKPPCPCVVIKWCDHFRTPSQQRACASAHVCDPATQNITPLLVGLLSDITNRAEGLQTGKWSPHLYCAPCLYSEQKL